MDSFLNIHVKHVFEGFVGVVFFIVFLADEAQGFR